MRLLQLLSASSSVHFGLYEIELTSPGSGHLTTAFVKSYHR